MTNAYSLDMRKRVVRFVEAGHSHHAAARPLAVLVSFVKMLIAAFSHDAEFLHQAASLLGRSCGGES
jgi:transposase